MPDEVTPLLYCIRDWDKYFEVNRTRELVRMTWVPMPNKQDGDGYTELLNHKDGTAHLGAWCALLQVASKCDPRGTLMRDGNRPHDFASLERISRVPAKLLECAMERLVTIGWVSVYEIPHDGAVIPHEAAMLPYPSIPFPSVPEKSVTHPLEAVRLAEHLAASILGWKPDYRELASDRKKNTLNRWAGDIAKALRIDKRKPETVAAIIDWLPSHEGRDDFKWRDQILCGKKLRDQYDKLDIAKNRPVKEKPFRNQI